MNIAIIGASRIAGKVINAFKAVNDLKVVGVASTSKEKLDKFSNDFKVSSIGNYADCFKLKHVDCVYVTTINCDHYNAVKEALYCEKHVLCEKPLVLKHSEAEELFDIAEKKGLILMEGFMYRFHPQVQNLKRTIGAYLKTPWLCVINTS